MMKSKTFSVIMIGGALFAMFFGAGNLVFPVQIGRDFASNVTPATLGFMITGVLLPVLAMIASATSENGINGIANRIGRIPGFIFVLMAFLATGMGYAIPRVAAASYEMSVSPHIKDDGFIGIAVYSAVFFLVAAAMAINPGKMLDKIGTWLTPALLILLVALITMSFTSLSIPSNDEVKTKYAELNDKYAALAQAPDATDKVKDVAKALEGSVNAMGDGSPMISGLTLGYGTLDAIASFVFGIIIITALKNRGFKPGKELFRGTAMAGVIAGLLLALVYYGLSNIGHRMSMTFPKGSKVPWLNGGEGLALAATELFGGSGQVIFGAIVILACLTTGVGLIGASTEFFMTIFTKVPRNVMILIHVVISWAIASIGLSALLKFAIVIMMFCYPIVITMTLVCLIDIFVPGHMYWTYRGFVWTSALFGLFDAINTAIASYGDLEAATGWSTFYNLIPLSGYGMGWIVPCMIFGIAGLIADGMQKRLSTWKKYSDEPVGLIFQKGLTSTAKERAEAAAAARGEEVPMSEE